MKNGLRCIIILGIVAVICFCVGCGDDDDESKGDTKPVTLKDGVFLDAAAVEGLRYETASQSGVTDSEGTFRYQEGETVEFSISETVILGQAPAEPVMTPVDLVGRATYETHPTVTNICRFLQTLDDDSNPENGISVTETSGNYAEGITIRFDLSITEFEEDSSVRQMTGSMARSLVSVAEAQEHMKHTLLADTENPYVLKYVVFEEPDRIQVSEEDLCIEGFGVGDKISVSRTADGRNDGDYTVKKISAERFAVYVWTEIRVEENTIVSQGMSNSVSIKLTEGLSETLTASAY
ncbi:hypothetical protein QUF80_23145 [Desulfococcaceae bacterium HSG8]|nr:hypothetical protein [Desulfococcaceae bacterium HSG8]